MNNIEHYKSLISDEEVIKALLKDSKVRGELFKEKTRLKPNLNFFHRTVKNLVSSNRRVTATRELLYNDTRRPSSKVKGKVKTPRMLIKEIVMSNQTDRVRATNSTVGLTEKETTKDAATQSSKYTKVSSSAERTDLSKRSSQNYYVPPFKTKSKGIVFNININRGGIGEPASPSGKLLEMKKESLSVQESIDEDVISLSSVSSFNECEVIQISGSDSD